MANPPGLINGIAPTCYVEPGTNITPRIIKDGACQLFAASPGNLATTARWLKLYDIAAAQLTTASGIVGAPPAWSIIIPGNAGGGGSNQFPAMVPFGGIQFLNGMVATVTTGPLATDISACGVAEIVVNLGVR